MILDEEKRRELLKLPTGNVADSVDGNKNAVMESAIKPIDPKSKMIGRAVTVECAPGDNLALHQGIEAAGAGDVLVFDCKGYTEAGHFGDMMATACKVKGIAGVVIDGSCRDSQDILELGLPVFVKTFNPSGTVKVELARINVPVKCGSAEVRPGDIIFGDCDGVVVVPQDEEDEVFQKALAKFDKEIEIKEKLLSGMSTMEVYGFDKLVEKKSGGK